MRPDLKNSMHKVELTSIFYIIRKLFNELIIDMMEDKETAPGLIKTFMKHPYLYKNANKIRPLAADCLAINVLYDYMPYYMKSAKYVYSVIKELLQWPGPDRQFIIDFLHRFVIIESPVYLKKLIRNVIHKEEYNYCMEGKRKYTKLSNILRLHCVELVCDKYADYRKIINNNIRAILYNIETFPKQSTYICENLLKLNDLCLYKGKISTLDHINKIRLARLKYTFRLFPNLIEGIDAMYFNHFANGNIVLYPAEDESDYITLTNCFLCDTSFEDAKQRVKHILSRKHYRKHYKFKINKRYRNIHDESFPIGEIVLGKSDSDKVPYCLYCSETEMKKRIKHCESIEHKLIVKKTCMFCGVSVHQRHEESHRKSRDHKNMMIIKYDRMLNTNDADDYVKLRARSMNVKEIKASIDQYENLTSLDIEQQNKKLIDMNNILKDKLMTFATAFCNFKMNNRAKYNLLLNLVREKDNLADGYDLFRDNYETRELTPYEIFYKDNISGTYNYELEELAYYKRRLVYDKAIKKIVSIEPRNEAAKQMRLEMETLAETILTNFTMPLEELDKLLDTIDEQLISLRKCNSSNVNNVTV